MFAVPESVSLSQTPNSDSFWGTRKSRAGEWRDRHQPQHSTASSRRAAAIGHGRRGSRFETSLFPTELCDQLVKGACAFGGDRRCKTYGCLQAAVENRHRSGVRETFNPVQRAKDVGIAPEIIFAGGNTENVAAALVSDGAPDTLREKSELIVRRLFAGSAGSPGSPVSRFSSSDRVSAPDRLSTL